MNNKQDMDGDNEQRPRRRSKSRRHRRRLGRGRGEASTKGWWPGLGPPPLKRPLRLALLHQPWLAAGLIQPEPIGPR